MPSYENADKRRRATSNGIPHRLAGSKTAYAPWRRKNCRSRPNSKPNGPRLDKLAGEVRQKDQRIETAETQLRELHSKPQSGHQDERADWSAKMDALRVEKDAQIDRLKREITGLKAFRAQPKQAVRTSEASTQQNALDLSSSGSAAGPSASQTAPPGATPTDQSDDLKKIHGIGPVMERTLNQLGITRYRQIATFTEADIERVADEIDTFPGRIKRDDWIGGAKKAHLDKYGENL